MVYKWKSTHDWLCDAVRNTRVTTEELLTMICEEVDADTIQDWFEDTMDEDGFFEED